MAEGDQPVIGPQVIIEYLDETRAPLSRIEKLFPGSPLGRAGPERPTITVELRRKNVPVDITRFIG